MFCLAGGQEIASRRGGREERTEFLYLVVQQEIHTYKLTYCNRVTVSPARHHIRSPQRCYVDFQVIIFSKIFCIAGRLITSLAQQRLINFHALSLKGGLFIRGGRFPSKTSFASWRTCTPSKGTAPNWICTSSRSISRYD